MYSPGARHFVRPRNFGRAKRRKPDHQSIGWPSRKKPPPVGREAIYRVYFHGPAYRVLQEVRIDGETAWGLLARDLPPGADPPSAATLVAPRLVELGFQTAGIWEVATKERLALPAGLKLVRAYRGEEDAHGGDLWAVASATDGGATFDVRVVDERGNVFVELLGYRTVALEGRVTL